MSSSRTRHDENAACGQGYPGLPHSVLSPEPAHPVPVVSERGQEAQPRDTSIRTRVACVADFAAHHAAAPRDAVHPRPPVLACDATVPLRDGGARHQAQPAQQSHKTYISKSAPALEHSGVTIHAFPQHCRWQEGLPPLDVTVLPTVGVGSASPPPNPAPLLPPPTSPLPLLHPPPASSHSSPRILPPLAAASSLLPKKATPAPALRLLLHAALHPVHSRPFSRAPPQAFRPFPFRCFAFDFSSACFSSSPHPPCLSSAGWLALQRRAGWHRLQSPVLGDHLVSTERLLHPGPRTEGTHRKVTCCSSLGGAWVERHSHPAAPAAPKGTPRTCPCRRAEACVSGALVSEPLRPLSGLDLRAAPGPEQLHPRPSPQAPSPFPHPGPGHLLHKKSLY